jgi:hypothetical protein
MSWRGSTVEVVNNVLGWANCAVQRRSFDFDDRLASGRHLSLMFQRLAAAMGAWLGAQAVFPVIARFDLEAEIAAFYADYLDAPFREQNGGSRFNNALWLNVIAKTLQPTLIVDSGSYTGASAWALSRGAPAATVVSFDIDLSHLHLRAPNVRYVQSDWSTFDLSRQDTSRALCYFDDHIDQAKRVLEASGRGIGTAIFDDDLSLGAFPAMAGKDGALPKIEFVLDDKLVDGEKIEWMARGRRRSWRVDRGYLDRARAKIAIADRLPNTSLITGIHQTPYRLVALR